MLVWKNMMFFIVKMFIYIVIFLGMVLLIIDIVAGFLKFLALIEKLLFDYI